MKCSGFDEKTQKPCTWNLRQQGNQWQCLNDNCTKYLEEIIIPAEKKEKKPSLVDRLKALGK